MRIAVSFEEFGSAAANIVGGIESRAATLSSGWCIRRRRQRNLGVEQRNYDWYAVACPASFR